GCLEIHGASLQHNSPDKSLHRITDYVLMSKLAYFTDTMNMQPINLIGAVCTSAHEWDGAKNTKQLDIDHKNTPF
ncbi:hypothetical protein DL298_12800, partial [Shigella sonnei]|nr:hypothetical protein [Shigella sonnei]EGD9048762.1 hypothetical protein [Shigella sonnei]EGE2849767.1 hypothetical protein [Shigella sonnei]